MGCRVLFFKDLGINITNFIKYIYFFLNKKKRNCLII